MSKYEEKLGEIRIGLRKDLVVTRQEMGGRPRYVMHDPLAFQNHAVSTFEYRVISALVPSRTLAENFTILVERGVMDEGRKDEFYEFVLGLHEKKVLQLPMSQAEHLFKKFKARQDAKRRNWYQAVLYFNVPLFNPDRFLDRTVRYFGWMFSRVGLALWVLLSLVVMITCLGRFGEMVAHSSSLLDIQNLPVMWFALVVLKVIHEFGHAYACKKFGGEVPRMGLAFIVLTPCAFVDASAAWKFPNRWQRIAVSLGGMYVESIVAGIFAIIWASTQAGFLHDVSLAVVVLASVITVFMNLNPLLKFDGYYVFSDLLGVINLKQRADLYLKSFTRKLALGLPRIPNSYTKWEKWVYGLYAPCSFLYKIFLAISITAMIVLAWPAAGMILGFAFAWLLIVQPMKRLLGYLMRSEDTIPVRQRAKFVAAGVFVVFPLLLWYLPISTSVVAPGVLEPLERYSVRAPVSGFVERTPVGEGGEVTKGDLLVVLRNPSFEMRHLEVQGEMNVEKVRLDAEEAVDASAAETSRARLKYLEARSVEMRRRLQSMDVRADLAGTLVRTRQNGWLGSHVKLGQELYQVHSKDRLLRVVLTDQEVLRAQLSVGSEAVVRWPSAEGRSVRAIVKEIRRSASRTEVPRQVTMLGGGDIYAQSDGDEDAVADRPFLHVFLEVEEAPLSGHDGLTAKVRVRARVETLGLWIRRSLVGFYNAWKMS